ncbi:hypothetical protein DMENIID0001_038450 [Sergentomyia squamirostris]
MKYTSVLVIFLVLFAIYGHHVESRVIFYRARAQQNQDQENVETGSILRAPVKECPQGKMLDPQGRCRRPFK